MAVYDLEEQEQLDELKAWWKQWRNAITAAIAVFVIVFAGIQWWRNHERTLAVEASTLFATVQKVAGEKDVKKVLDAVKAITDKHPGSAYAGRAALVAAKVAFDKGDLGTAKSQLEWAIGNAKEDEIKSVARLRLAGLLGDEKKFDDGLKLLDANTGTGFEAATSLLRGDLLAVQGKLAEAKTAYTSAMAKSDPRDDKRSIQAKLDALGGVK